MVTILSLLVAGTWASEGLWRPEQLPQLATELKAAGVPDAARLAELGKAPLAAIVDLDHCSGAFVSPDGLVGTAYHCISDALQHASKEGEDLFANGFYAPSREHERWGGPSLVVRVTVSVEDVGQQMVAGTRRLEGSARFDAIEANRRSVVARCESEADVHCEVVSYGQGAEYQLVRQREFRDVRLVYAPPMNVGYFGGDADNWQWPRHSGDFAFLRVYAGKNGAPAAPSPTNQALSTPAHLKAAPIGPKPGEFVMVAGYPGGTYRWRTAVELDYAQEEQYPREIRTARDQLAILQLIGERNRDLAPKVAPTIFSLTNDVQYLEGNLAAFERSGLQARKWEFERDLSTWIASDVNRTERFADVLDRIHRLQAEEASTAARDHVAGAMREGSMMLDAALTLYELSMESRKPDAKRREGYQNRDRPEIEARFATTQSSWDHRVDRAMLRYFLVRAMELPAGLHIPELDAWIAAQNVQGSPEQQADAILERLYRNVELADAERRRALMDTSPWYLSKSGNPWFELAEALEPYYARMDAQADARQAEWQSLRPRYVQAVQEFVPEARPRYMPTAGAFAPGLFYHDANSTLRVTIGTVDGYAPRDGLIAAARTTVHGVREKASWGTTYQAPATLLTAIDRGEWGPYAAPGLGAVGVNYVTTLDTARGSSGSPTIDASGRWVGIIFDGNYESMAADWVFDESITRSIHTDIAYVLWYLDAVAGADDLVRELGLEPTLASVSMQGPGSASGPLLWE